MKQRKVFISQNISWIFQKGSWFIHILLTFFIKLTLSQFLSQQTSWQMTVIIYNLLTFYFFHWRVGDPFCREFYNCTVWEQIVEQSEDTIQVRFLALYPSILFIIVNKIVKYCSWLYFVNLGVLILVVVPKLSFMHMKRIFGYNSFN